eukprot:189975-Pleurochrysis_carterae.AAC.1
MRACACASARAHVRACARVRARILRACITSVVALRTRISWRSFSRLAALEACTKAARILASTMPSATRSSSPSAIESDTIRVAMTPFSVATHWPCTAIFSSEHATHLRGPRRARGSGIGY